MSEKGRGLKLVVLGATGATGLEVVRQAIEHGHSVTAFVRSPDRMGALASQVTVRKGDLLDCEQLARVIEGHDAVLSAFGPRLPISKAEAHLLEQFATALASAMERTSVTRVIVESVAFLFRDAIMPPTYFLGKLLFPAIVKDSAAMEEVFERSALEWTMVRPPELTNKPFTGKYRVRENHLPHFGFTVSRADVADCMIKLVENGESIRKVGWLIKLIRALFINRGVRDFTTDQQRGLQNVSLFDRIVLPRCRGHHAIRRLGF